MRKQLLLEFSHPRKSAVEELLLIDHNLEEVARSLEELLKLVPTRKVAPSVTTSDSIRARSLYCFAAVSYVRCFTAGYRVRLEISKIPRLTFLDRKLHEEIRAIRNKYFAHAVDSLHEGTHLYLVTPRRGSPSTGFTALHIVLASESTATLRHFIRLVGKVRGYVQNRTAVVGDELARTTFGSKATWSKFYVNRARKAKSETPNPALNADPKVPPR